MSGALALGRILGRVTWRTLAGAFSRRHRRGDVTRQMFEIGNRSLLFVMLTVGFIGIVLVFQTCLQLLHVTGDVSPVGGPFIRAMVFEFGPTLTAMMLATRVGAGIAAEVGSMVVTEQIDAMRMSGVEPIEYLVVPRFLASLLMTTVLTCFGIFAAVLAGAATAYSSFHLNPHVFFDFGHVEGGDIATGLMKTVAYGAVIPIVSGACGLEARGGSEGVGRATTLAVISSSLAVILLDLVLSSIGLQLFPRID